MMAGIRTYLFICYYIENFNGDIPKRNPRWRFVRFAEMRFLLEIIMVTQKTLALGD